MIIYCDLYSFFLDYTVIDSFMSLNLLRMCLSNILICYSGPAQWFLDLIPISLPKPNSVLSKGQYPVKRIAADFLFVNGAQVQLVSAKNVHYDYAVLLLNCSIFLT